MHVDTPIKVRYGETDMMGVVYHANYLLYFEDARIDFLDALDFSYSEQIEDAGFMSPIHAVEIQYKSPFAMVKRASCARLSQRIFQCELCTISASIAREAILKRSIR